MNVLILLTALTCLLFFYVAMEMTSPSYRLAPVRARSRRARRDGLMR